MYLRSCCPGHADPPVQFLDDEKRPKYIIAVDRDGKLPLPLTFCRNSCGVSPSWLSMSMLHDAGDAAEPPAIPGMRTITMTDKTGKRYTCKMPAADQQAVNSTAEAEQVGCALAG